MFNTTRRFYFFRGPCAHAHGLVIAPRWGYIIRLSIN